MEGEPPENLEAVEPASRIYPPSWRDAAIRTLYDPKEGGVRCSGCKKWFHGRRDLSLLECDHIHPWSAGGLTTWANLQLLCRPCNRTKSNKVQHVI